MNPVLRGGRWAPTAVALLLAFTLAACDNPQRTVDDLRQQIATYKTAPTDTTQAAIEADLAKLDQHVDKLTSQGKTAEAAGLRATVANLRADYRAARMVRSLKDAQTAIQGIGEAIKDAGQSLGEAFKPTPPPAQQP